jgi:hypothetical protein
MGQQACRLGGACEAAAERLGRVGYNSDSDRIVVAVSTATKQMGPKTVRSGVLTHVIDFRPRLRVRRRPGRKRSGRALCPAALAPKGEFMGSPHFIQTMSRRELLFVAEFGSSEGRCRLSRSALDWPRKVPSHLGA